MVSIRNAIISALIFGLMGLCLMPFFLQFEESVGLSFLFKIRGRIDPPSDVVVVAIDMESANNLKLPRTPEDWPRPIHSLLIRNLIKEEAAVIVFDVFFRQKSQLNKSDNQFAEAIINAGNVILVERIHKEETTIKDREGEKAIELSIERPDPPLAILARASLASAPFPLPKKGSHSVNQYWVVKPTAGDVPTLPVVAFQFFALNVYRDFLSLMEKEAPIRTDIFPSDKSIILNEKGVPQLILSLRDYFKKNPGIAKKMNATLERHETFSMDKRTAKLLSALIQMYQQPDSRYLNFYGPPQTITTVPCYHLIQKREEIKRASNGNLFKGKAVFIGKTECLQSRQKSEGFPTVFSLPNGLDISGVEIAATAFANLLNNSHIRPLDFPMDRIVVFLWGMGIGLLCLIIPSTLGIWALIFVSCIYTAAAQYQFNRFHVWYPLVVPVLIQGPVAFLATSLWRYYDINKRRKIIRSALGKFIPNQEVDQLIKNKGDMKAGEKLVFGVCMLTDAENITPLSEKMNPAELKEFMDRYYEVIFKPVEAYSGYPQDVTGDAVMSVWTAELPDVTMRKNACMAAMEIDRILNRKGPSSNGIKLPTRVGLHCGLMVRGNVGAGIHFEYRVVGDVVITATRIEGLNKHLGTRVLASKEVLHQLDSFLTRNIGDFLLVGKLEPINVSEIMTLREAATEGQISLCAVFAEGLAAFQSGNWEMAKKRFAQCIRIRDTDGPSLFYLNLCKSYAQSLPPDDWNGVVRMFTK